MWPHEAQKPGPGELWGPAEGQMYALCRPDICSPNTCSPFPTWLPTPCSVLFPLLSHSLLTCWGPRSLTGVCRASHRSPAGGKCTCVQDNLGTTQGCGTGTNRGKAEQELDVSVTFFPQGQNLTPATQRSRALFWLVVSVRGWLVPGRNNMVEGPGGGVLLTAWRTGSRGRREELGRDLHPRRPWPSGCLFPPGKPGVSPVVSLNHPQSPAKSHLTA